MANSGKVVRACVQGTVSHFLPGRMFKMLRCPSRFLWYSRKIALRLIDRFTPCYLRVCDDDTTTLLRNKVVFSTVRQFVYPMMWPKDLLMQQEWLKLAKHRLLGTDRLPVIRLDTKIGLAYGEADFISQKILLGHVLSVECKRSSFTTAVTVPPIII